MKRSKVEYLAQSLGANLLPIHKQPDGSKEIECIAPKGKLWNASDGETLLYVYYPDEGHKSSEIYTLLYEDLKEGLREMTDKQKIEYGYPQNSPNG